MILAKALPLGSTKSGINNHNENSNRKAQQRHEPPVVHESS